MPTRRLLLSLVLGLSLGNVWAWGQDYALPDPTVPFEKGEFSFLMTWKYEHTMAFNVRVLRVPASLYERIKDDYPIDSRTPLVCGDRCLQSLLDLVQSDPDSSILAIPQIETMEGKPGVGELVTEQQFVTGMQVVSKEDTPALEPVTTKVSTGLRVIISGKQKNVGEAIDLDLAVSDTRIDRVETVPLRVSLGEKGKETVQNVECPHMVKNTLARTLTATLSEGRALVLPGWWENGEAHETPLRNGIAVPKEPQRVIVLLTARVIR
jgi:hypothetical protein